MVDTAVMLGANKDVATVDMKEVLDFEIDLHKASEFKLFIIEMIYTIILQYN